MKQDTITINKKELEELKKLYEKTPPKGVFIFKGKEILKEYAKYLIQHVEGKLNKE